MNITYTTEPHTYGYITADGQAAAYSNIPTTTYVASNDAGEELATIRVLAPTNEIIDATCLGSHFPVTETHYLIDLVESVGLGRDLCIGEPSRNQPYLINEIATSEELVDVVELMTAEGIDAENAAVLADWNAA